MPKPIEEYIKQLRAISAELSEHATRLPGDPLSELLLPLDGMIIANSNKQGELFARWVLTFGLFMKHGATGMELLAAVTAALHTQADDMVAAFSEPCPHDIPPPMHNVKSRKEH